MPDPKFMAAPFSVKPRKRVTASLPVVSVDRGQFLTELGEIGQVAPRGDDDLGFANSLIERLPTMPATLFSVQNAGDFVAELDAEYKHDPAWQWRAGAQERDIIRPGGTRVATRISTVIHYFGWKNRNFHKVIDPVSMYAHGLSKVWPGDDDPLYKLLAWAICLNDFCLDNGLEVKPTIGGISAQLLRAPRFYPKPRRKVPAAINQRVRENLPGNYYLLNVEPSEGDSFSAYYLDQHRAHHYHAQRITFPHADHLYAYGRFVDLDVCVLPEPIPDFHGLYCLDLEPTPNWWLDGFNFTHPSRLEAQFIYSNELPHLLDLGYRVKGVRAAWGSLQPDVGLNKLAAWACEQLDKYDDAPWLKPLLLSTYGTLATKPRENASVFRQAKTGEQVQLFTGRHKLSGKLTRGQLKLEPGTANVLHRGMIEAATRSDSIGLAQWLHYHEHHILAIYADAVIVKADDDNQLPNLPEPWRCKRQLTHLQFINQQAFTSNEMSKLPGGLAKRSRRGHAPHALTVEEQMERAEGPVYLSNMMKGR